MQASSACDRSEIYLHVKLHLVYGRVFRFDRSSLQAECFAGSSKLAGGQRRSGS